MVAIAIKRLRWATKVWAIQKRYPRVKFTPKHFTSEGTLSIRGKKVIAVIRKKRR